MSPDNKYSYIYVSRFNDEQYSKPEMVSVVLNEHGAAHAYIAPDESYLIFDSDYAQDCLGELDLYISFQDRDGSWMRPQNMGEKINTLHDERRPFVSFDGKYLFFASNRIEKPNLPTTRLNLEDLKQLTNVPADSKQHIFWVDAKIIEDLKPVNLK
ncbi:PD40 domain-containing protein [bacterium]|nr:PD40 domain-containing protein [bacterium]